MARVHILGVPIDPLTRDEVLHRLTGLIAARLPSQVVTVNPEFLIAAQHNRSFRQVLATAELAVADGVGIRAAATYRSRWLPTWQPARLIVSFLQGVGIGAAVLLAPRALTDPVPETVTGVDLVDALAARGEREGWRYYLVGGDPGVARAAATVLQQRHPGLQITGAEEGIPKGTASDTAARILVDRIRRARPDVLFVAFGAPTQDTFIARYKTKLDVPVMMGVGGSFDFIAGTVQRAPAWLRTLGLEWLWRFLHQPWRWRRILTAVIVFPWQIFLARQRVR